MTYSIVALDAATGDLGVAIQSKFLAVGAVVPWARAERRRDRDAVVRERRATGRTGWTPWPRAGPAAEVLAALVARRPAPGAAPGRHRGSARDRRHAHRARVLRVGRRPDRPRLRRPGQHPRGRRASSTASRRRSRPAARRSPSSWSRAWRPPRPPGGDRRGRESAALLHRPSRGRLRRRQRPLHRPPGRRPRRSRAGAGAGPRDLQRLYLDRPAVEELLPARRGPRRRAALAAHDGRRGAGRQVRGRLPADVAGPRRGAAGRRQRRRRRPPDDRHAAPAAARAGTTTWQGALAGLDGRREPGGADRGAGLDRPARAGASSDAKAAPATPARGNDERPSVQPTAVLGQCVTVTTSGGRPR